MTTANFPLPKFVLFCILDFAFWFWKGVSPVASSTQRRPQLKKPKKRRPGPLLRIYRILVVVSAIIVALYAWYTYMTRLPPVPSVPDPGPDASADVSADPAGEQTAGRQRKEGYYTFLLCATDHGNGGTDTIILASYDTVSQQVNMVSVPRDTLFLNDSGKVRKINSAYNSGGIQELDEQLEKMLGIPIDYYVKVDLKGFEDAVNLIGGVEFDIPCAMNYDDDTPGQELHIHFEPGLTRLNGADALKVVRFRKNNDGSGYTDVGRMQTQQAFIKAVISQTLKVSNLTKVGELVNIVTSHVETNLSVSDITAFANQVLTRFNTDNMTSNLLPGDYAARYPYPSGGWYVALDPQGTVDMVNQYLNPYDQDVTLDDVVIHTLNSNHQVYQAS